MRKLTLILCLLLISCNIDLPEINIETQPEPQTPEPLPTSDSITIANWNIQVLGQSKWSKPDIKEKILNTLPNYDIIFIQEIRDKSQEVFQDICKEMQPYNCYNSSRAGRSSSKEQYGILYKKNIKLTTTDHNPSLQEFFERPPIQAEFKIQNYSFTAFNIHIKPDDVEDELNNLQNLTANGNVIYLGDFNADGSYYNEDNNKYFLDHHWIIDNTEDTTIAKSDNTYDRIILNDDMYKEYIEHGIYKDINKSVSDHYLVWINISI